MSGRKLFKPKSKDSVPEAEPLGPINYMPDEMIHYIAASCTFEQAALLARTNSRHYALLRLPLNSHFINQFNGVDVVIDRTNTYCITRSGQVGSCLSVRLGAKRFQLIPALRDVKQVLDSGYEFSLFVKKTGEVYAQGESFNEYYPQTYLPASSAPLAVAAFQGQRIMKVMDDGYSACFLTHTGQVYAVGSDAWGELGQFIENVAFPNPSLLISVPPVQDIYYNSHQLLLFTAQGMFATGRNELGQLGVGHRQNISLPMPMLLGDIIIRPGSVRAAGMRRFYALTAQGQVCAWGDNSDGMLGFGDRAEYNRPALLPMLHDVVCMSVTDKGAVFVDKHGSAFVLGVNDDGELGLGDRLPRIRPTRNPHLPPIQKVFCKAGKSFFVCGGKVFFAGRTNGHFVEKPQLIFDKPESVEQIECYLDDFVFRTSDGVIYVDKRQQRLLQAGVLSSSQAISFFPVVKKIIKSASVRDLLFYAQNGGGLGRYCFERALDNMAAVRDVDDLVGILLQLNSSNWNNCEDIKALLPAYHLVLRYATDHPEQGDAIAGAWAQLLIMYKDLSEVDASGVRMLNFREMLTWVAAYNPLGSFRSPLNGATKALYSQLEGEPSVLKVAAKFLLQELPVPEGDSLKRAAEDGAEDGDRKLMFKKSKK